MASSSLAPEAGRLPTCNSNNSNSSALSAPPPAPPPAQAQDSSSLRPSHKKTLSNSSSSHTNTLHAHRQNHSSSKLPAFRFADLKDPRAVPALLQHIPPSPVSPTAGQQSDLQQGPPHAATVTHHNPGAGPKPGIPTSPPSTTPPKSPSSPVRTRASTLQSASNAAPTAAAKRPVSYPDSPRATNRIQRTLTDPPPPPSSSSTTRPYRRAPASFSANGLETSHGPPSSLNTKRLHAAQAAQAEKTDQLADHTTKEWAQGQRELLLPKSLSEKPADEKKKPVSRPPVSFKAPRNDGSSPRAVIPPIRAFRSSGSRKSLVLDMNARPLHGYDDGDGTSDPNQRDRTLRALEGRGDDDYLQMMSPNSVVDALADGGENTADIFMRIAQERPREEQSTAPRTVRTFHRRPFSAAIPSSYQPTSPPRISRRLSDQRENSAIRRFGDDQSAQQMPQDLSYRALSRAEPGAETSRTSRTLGSARPSPRTPRSAAFHDASADASPYSKRRASLTDGSSTLQARAASYKATYGLPKNYNSSPLVPRHPESQRQELQDLGHGIEGTESSASTAAPSTVWDELDDLKSRMRRLELTGKIPPTSGAAMSRVSDDRPRTATTNATTMSASPKRSSGNAQAEASSTTSSQREPQPILFSALSKAKAHISAEVYEAIESAATDALALSQMVGVAGHPGPISSGASTIGTGGIATVTDRQLRRKADSICRNLTELCLALNDEAAQRKTGQPPAPREKDAPPVSPTVVKGFAGLSASRRPSAIADPATNPRPLARPDDRRSAFLNSPALPSPRFGPSTPTEAVGRKSSLLISRTRRAGTEEPEEASRGQSSLLRTRRAGTEEPDEGRNSSLLIRRRAAGDDDDDDESRFRAPSRAVTEVAGLRGSQREYGAQMGAPDNASLASSALPRRRLVPSSLNSRLPAAQASLAGRRYMERSTPERDTNSVAEKLAEDRGQRPLSLGQTAMLNRSGSLNRRVNRDSAIPSISATASQVGGYR